MINPIILSGGNGTRLWPISRQQKPKQFIEFIDGESMFTQTVKRFKDKKLFSDPIIIGNINHLELIKKEVKKNRLVNTEIILEPKPRNTAPAIAAIIEYLHQNKRDEEIVVFVSSDAYIGNIKEFQNYLKEGEKIAEQNKIVCFGIQPLYPEIAYGYIKRGRKINNNIYLVKNFIEKPEFKKAISFLKSMEYLWNAGIFMAKVSNMRKLFKKLQKNLYNNIELTIKNSFKDKNILYLNNNIFIQSQEISIDYAIIEKLTSKNLAVVSMNLLWSDLGSFKSLYDINSNKTKENNLTFGNVILNNTENCFIRSYKKMICCSDLDDLVIVEENDIILIIKKDKSQNIKKIIDKIKENNLDRVL